MTCREFAEFIAEYLSGEILPDTRALFERHLEQCRNCRQYLVDYESSIKLGRAAFAALDDSLPDEVPEDLIKAVLAARRSSHN